MAFDGITVASLVRELNTELNNGRIYKISQPEADMLILTVKTQSSQKRLLLSANPSLPLACITENNRPAPLNAPNFCMLLRKYIQNGRILSVTQPGLERCIRFEILHLDEMGDPKTKVLIVELMGKHSNIILCDHNGMILDSIKHISAQISSVREVLPGREYFLPDTMDKHDPLSTDPDSFREIMRACASATGKALYSSFTGISPVMAEEICHRACVDSALPVTELSENELIHLSGIFNMLMEDVKAGSFSCGIYLINKEPREYSAVPLNIYQDLECRSYDSMSELINEYYSEKERITRIRHKSSDLRHIVATALERSRRKYDIQLKQLKDTEKRDKYRVYGELINTYGYSVPPKATSMEALNYYTGENITIPLDPNLTTSENAVKYFDRYNKLKRTYEALSIQSLESAAEISYLESVAANLEMADDEENLKEIKDELKLAGYIRFHAGDKKSRSKSQPYHYISSDGFHMYVGKNNLQNEYLTLKFASNSDWWFHSKKYPGSHVIVKAEGRELPDATFEEAASLAAHYSKGGAGDRVEIDYVMKKHLKKPAGALPGYVIYHTNYSMLASTDISGIKQIENISK